MLRSAWFVLIAVAASCESVSLEPSQFACTGGGPCLDATVDASTGDAGLGPDATGDATILDGGPGDRGVITADAGPADAAARDAEAKDAAPLDAHSRDAAARDADPTDATPIDTGPPAAPARRIAVGAGHGCAVQPSGDLACWGDDELGKLGRGGLADSAFETATSIPWPDVVRVVAAGRLDPDLLEESLDGVLGSGTRQRCGDSNDLPCPPSASCINTVCDDGGGDFPSLAFEIPHHEDATTGATVCRDAPSDPNRRRCVVWLTNAALTLTPQTIDQFEASIDARLLTEAMPVRLESAGADCVVTIDSARTGSPSQEILIDITVEAWDPGLVGRPRLALATGDIRMQIPDGDVSVRRDPVHGGVDDIVTCTLANLGSIKQRIVEAMATRLGAVLADSLDVALGWPCQTGADCPVGTTCIADVCREASSGRVVHRQLPYSGGHTCAMDDNADVRCWGRGDEGALGAGSFAHDSVPSATGSFDGATVVDLAARKAGACAVTDAGEVWCWGTNVNQAFGPSFPRSTATPTRIMALDGALEVAASSQGTCTRGGSRQVRCVGAWTGAISNVTDPQALAVGDGHGCAIEDGGSVVCWGANGAGQLGDGTMSSRPGAAGVIQLGGATAIAAGAEHTCAVISTGHVYCWGANSAGQVGPGVGATAPMATEVPTINDAVDVAAGRNFTCALRAGGAVTCWGDGRWGRFGDRMSSGPGLVDVPLLP